MIHSIILEIPNIQNIAINLDDSQSPKTVKSFVAKLPFTVGLNLWGDEIYTNESPVSMQQENAKDLVALNDVAYWPTGKAICLFYGPTPIGSKGQIKPYSAVNIIGKIIHPDKKVLKQIKDGDAGTFRVNQK